MGSKHIWNRFDFRGTYGAIAAAKDGIEPMVCDVIIDEWSKSGMKETRAFRHELKRKGKKVPTLRDDILHDELFVFVGPQMSVASAVKRLREVIRYIKKEGMLTGMDSSDDYVVEKEDGSFCR